MNKNKLINNNSLVFIKRNEPFTNSKIIAECAGIKHHAIQQLISNYKSDFEEFGKIRFTHLKCENLFGGRPEKVYYLNEQQSTLLLTYSKNTEKVREFKKTLVKAFYKAKQLIEEKKTPEWKQMRIESKSSTKALHDDIHDKFIPYAIENGSKTYEKRPSLAYTHFENPINKALDINNNSRELIGTYKQNLLDIMNKSCSMVIDKEIIEQTDYHDIVNISKDKLTKIHEILLH